MFSFLPILWLAPQSVDFCVIVICFFLTGSVPFCHSLLCGSSSNAFTQVRCKTFMSKLPWLNEHSETHQLLGYKFSKGRDPFALTLIDVQGFVTLWPHNRCHRGHGQQLWGIWILTLPLISSHLPKCFHRNARFSSSENIMSANSYSHHRRVNKNSKCQKTWHCQHYC